MKRIYIISAILLLLSSTNGYSQRIWGNPIGQYAYNPAGAAMSDLSEIVAAYYHTYASANNSPRGYMLMGSATFPNQNMGAGFKFNSEPAGVLTNLSAEATYVYKVAVSMNSKLSFGLSGTFNQMGIDDQIVNPQHAQDPILLLGAESGYWFDMNFGISLNEANQYYLGVACNNLLGQQTDWLLSDYYSFENRAARLISISGMYSFNLMHGDAKLETTGTTMFYVPEDEYSVVYDFNARFIFKKAFWAGMGYTNNMAKILLGLYIQNINIGYAGGIGLGEIAAETYSLPKHEIFLRLELDTSKSSRKNVSR